MDKLIVSSIISAGIMCLMQTLLGLGTAEAEDARDGPPDADDPEYDVEDVDGEAPPIYGECGDLALLTPECPPHPLTRSRPGHFKRRSRRTQWHERDREETKNKRSRSKQDDRSPSPPSKRSRRSSTERPYEI